MRKDLQVELPILIEAIKKLGYRKMGRHLEFRRGKYHIILDPKKKRVTLYLHVDIPVHATPLITYHKARKQGKDIEQEYRRLKIMLMKIMKGEM